MKQHFVPIVFLLLLLSVCFAGCATLESPRISLSNLALEETTGFETVLKARLRVLNPNDIDLNITGVDCTLEINDKKFAYGISNTAVQVPAFSSTTVPVTVYASAIGIARGLAGMPGREEVSYQVKGKIRLAKTGWLLSRLRFKSEGTLTLKDLEAWLAPEPR